MKTGRPKHSGARLYDMGGEQFTALQLAQLAQCSAVAMTARLRRYSAAQAVAMGKADKHRERAPQTYDTPHGRAPHTKFYKVGHESLTVDDLAARAGCSRATMHTRLRTHKPESAIAMGAACPNRPRKLQFRIKPSDAKPAKPERAPKPPDPPKPAAVKQTKPASSADLSAKSWAIQAKKKAPKVAAPTGPVVMLPGAKITRAPAPVGRFAVDPRTVPCTFGRIGQYEDSGSALERAYGALSCADSHAGGR